MMASAETSLQRMGNLLKLMRTADQALRAATSSPSPSALPFMDQRLPAQAKPPPPRPPWPPSRGQAPQVFDSNPPDAGNDPNYMGGAPSDNSLRSALLSAAMMSGPPGLGGEGPLRLGHSRFQSAPVPRHSSAFRPPTTLPEFEAAAEALLRQPQQVAAPDAAHVPCPAAAHAQSPAATSQPVMAAASSAAAAAADPEAYPRSQLGPPRQPEGPGSSSSSVPGESSGGWQIPESLQKQILAAAAAAAENDWNLDPRRFASAPAPRRPGLGSPLGAPPAGSSAQANIAGRVARGPGATGSQEPQQAWPSIGSLRHNSDECKPCLFWYRGICHKRQRCLFCHIPHDPNEVSRVRPSKKTRNLLANRDQK